MPYRARYATALIGHLESEAGTEAGAPKPSFLDRWLRVSRLHEQRIDRDGHQLVGERVRVRITRHRPCLFRPQSCHCGEQVNIDVTVLPSDSAHDVVDEVEFVID